ncbi:aldo/keto reductase [Profundibacter sp.]
MSEVLPLVSLGKTGLQVSPLGLGCSKIASLSTRATPAQIDRLLNMAWDGGVRFFDTADIYGQGDSERKLAAIAARQGAVICTKAGLALTASQTAVRLIKPVMRPLLARMRGARKVAANARAASEIHDLDRQRLTKRLEQSLRRLRRDQVDIFLLHSPPRDALRDGALFDLLDQFRARGLAHAVGVSCQTLEDAHWIAQQNRVQVLQIPLRATGLAAAAPILEQAQKAGIGLIAREVMATGIPATDALPPLLRDARIAVTLTGTTNASHLLSNLNIARSL